MGDLEPPIHRASVRSDRFSSARIFANTLSRASLRAGWMGASVGGHDGKELMNYGRGMRKGYVYILANKPYGTLYIGVTSDLSARLEQHRRGIASAFTEKYGVTRLVYCEAHDWMTSAIQRESSLKRWKREWKIELIESINPNWDDLEKTLG